MLKIDFIFDGQRIFIHVPENQYSKEYPNSLFISNDERKNGTQYRTLIGIGIDEEELMKEPRFNDSTNIQKLPIFDHQSFDPELAQISIVEITRSTLQDIDVHILKRVFRKTRVSITIKDYFSIEEELRKRFEFYVTVKNLDRKFIEFELLSPSIHFNKLDRFLHKTAWIIHLLLVGSGYFAFRYLAMALLPPNIFQIAVLIFAFIVLISLSGYSPVIFGAYWILFDKNHRELFMWDLFPKMVDIIYKRIK